MFHHRIEYSEELQLIPSHLFYVSAATCVVRLCIAEANAFDPSRGELFGAESFRASVRLGPARGAKNIQWVGGEPTVHLAGHLGHR